MMVPSRFATAATASFSDAGFTYENAFTEPPESVSIRSPGAFLVDRGQDAVRMQRQAANGGAGGIAHRVGNRRRGGKRRGLADADDTTLGHVVDHDVDLRHVRHARQ